MVIVTGLVLGVIASVLVKLGNPGNMGLCLACFQRDIAGALGLHRAAVVQYLRPEILGIVLGATLAALFSREFVARSGSSPALRFVLGMFVMIGALVFLGCPTRMVLRLGGGDCNALTGLAGFIAGIAAGSLLLRRGTTLGRSHRGFSGSAWVIPLLAVGGVILVLTRPSFIFFSEKGPGSMHAPVLVSLGAGILIGVLGYRSRLCFAGGIRDMILFRAPHLLSGLVAVFVGVFVTNLVLGLFHLGFAGQPAAHEVHLWNFLGMLLVGLGSMLLGGCPFRQSILASQGNGDSALAVLGMITGAAIAHNFGLAASPKGVPTAGMIAVALGLVICLVVGITAREKVNDDGKSRSI
ncbi:YedE family putative selenium transporter [Verrucomicrobiota bacterium]